MVPCLLMHSPQTDYILGFQKAVSNAYTHSCMCTHRQCSLPHTILANAISASLWRLIHPTFALRCRKKKRDVFILSTTLGQEATVRTGHGTTDRFQIGKGVYCHPAYLTYMQSTSCEMLDWMKRKLESRLLGEISITSDMQMTPHLWQNMKKN